MALSCICEKGHNYIKFDNYIDYPKGAPYCPECYKEWENNMYKINILFLDDNDERINSFLKSIHEDKVVVCKTAMEAITELSKDVVWDVIFLDHDLGGEVFVDSNREDCGMEVVRWIQEHNPKIDNIVVHSWNTGASELMVSKLIDSGYDALYRPFGTW